MRILWFHSGLMPHACDALGYDKRNSCGWLESMLDALVAHYPDLELCLVGWDSRPCDIKIGQVRHVSFAYAGPTWYDKIPEVLSNKARRIICEFSPDVIHIQGTEYFYGCFDDSVYGSIPVVVSLQGIISGLYPHYSGGLTIEDLRGTNMNARYVLKGRSIFSEQRTWEVKRAVQEQKVLRKHKNFIGRTKWDRGWVEYINPLANYYNVNENLRPSFFAKHRRLEIVKRHSIYCGAAASCPLKGAHWLIRAVAKLKAQFPDVELRIAAAAQALLAPKGLKARLFDQSYHAYLRRLIKELGVEKNIVALPGLRAEEVAEELMAAELFVLPSMCENSPNSLGEAMLVGTPAIATFVGGVPSIIKDGIEGKLVPAGDPAALAEAIQWWFLHPEEAESCSAAAHDTALTRHDARRNAEATMAVYRGLIKK